MADAPIYPPAALEHAVRFLLSMTDAQVQDLAAGRLQLTLTTRPEEGSGRPTLTAIEMPAQELRDVLTALPSRAAAEAFVLAAKPKVEQLRTIAKSLGIPLPARSPRKQIIVDRIVEGTVGFRLETEAIEKSIEKSFD